MRRRSRRSARYGRAGESSGGRTAALALAAAFALAASAARGQSPFGVRAAETMRDGARAVEVSFAIPAGHILYAEPLSVRGPEDAPLSPLNVPAPTRKKDPFEDREVEVYTADFTAVYRAPAEARYEIAVGLQGCNDEVCFRPETRRFALPGGAPAEPGAAPAAGTEAETAAGPGGWRVVKRATGYRGVDDFLRFLDLDDTSDQAAPARAGWATILLILLGGIALNLTPCVLPMIPVNLAIIGAGARGGSRRRGLALGAAYGAAMSLAYGALGLFVVLTGAKFGTLNSSPWFNAVVAAVFAILGLAMVDVFAIDFSRFQPRVGGAAAGGGSRSKGRIGLAFVLGALAALLAGACVAPVVITVLLLAGRLYAEGHVYGLLLPFVLGLGMGLPWPVAGAGLAFLPKPGRWMVAVKYVFAAFIFVMAAYYGLVAWRGFRGSAGAGGAASGGGAFALSAASPAAAWDEVAAAARAQGKPVFVDFWATWCKNCHAMEKTTFRDPSVVARMTAFVVVKYQAERPNEPPARDLLDRLGVLGLPTYLILDPAGGG